MLGIRNRDWKIIQYLLEHPELDPGAFDNEALITALDFNHFDFVELLLKDDRVDPAARNNYAISSHFALHDERNLKLILDTGKVDASAHIIFASTYGNANVDPAANSNLAFQKAVQNGRTNVVKLLLSDERVNPADNNNAAGFI